MKKILEILEYFTAIANAISKGLKTVLENWPKHSPFGGDDNNTVETTATEV